MAIPLVSPGVKRAHYLENKLFYGQGSYSPPKKLLTSDTLTL